MNELQILNSIRHRMEHIPGHTGFYYMNLVTGTEFGVREDEVFGAASVIKLPLYMHILAESAAGHTSMDEKLTITQMDKVPICGALTLFTDDVQTDIRTLCRKRKSNCSALSVRCACYKRNFVIKITHFNYLLFSDNL